MLQSAIIVFREVLEIALVISVLIAGTKTLPNRARWVIAGLIAGIIGSGIVAFFAGRIAEAAEGMGQDLFNAGVLLAATIMIGWTVVWMRQHGRAIAEHLKHVGRAVTEGELPLYTLATIIALAVLREGSEIVLFSYGALASGTSLLSILSGAALGLAGGTAIGFILYLGLVKIHSRHLFSVTGWLLVFLAAGMAGKAAHFLVSADRLPELGASVWDSSAMIPEDSLAGQFLHALLGYSAQPSGMQLLFYGATIIILSICLKIFAPKAPTAKAH